MFPGGLVDQVIVPVCVVVAAAVVAIAVVTIVTVVRRYPRHCRWRRG